MTTTNQLKGILDTSRRADRSLRLVTSNGYALTLSANAYDVAAWVGSDAAADIDRVVGWLRAQPVTDADTVRDRFRSECTEGAEGDTERAWLEYADEIVDAACRQAPEAARGAQA